MHLRRRDFLKTTALASAATALGVKLSAAGSESAASGSREFYELRAYRLKPGAPHTALDGYLEKAFIPALNARGIKAVGVFTEPEAKDGPAVWVLIPHASLDSVLRVTAEVNFDPVVQAAGADYLNVPKGAPAFDRLDSWLLLAFTGMPQMAVPALKTQGKDRILELRTYESHSELKARKKIDMFNAGEIELMQQLGLSPVFYGEALVGRDLPHLTYMLCGPDRETHAKNWKAFFDHPVWLKLKNDPQYADTVNKVTSRFFVPTAFSQI
jgi:hypothetical protein